MKEIFGALAKAQSHFEAAFKSAANPQFRSKYAGLDACVDAVRDALNAEGIFLTQTVEPHNAGILVETVFLHSSGEIYTGGKLFMPVNKQDAQGYGSALTYGRRYSLLAACGVAPEDDDGNAATAAKPVAKPVKPFDITGVLDKVQKCTTLAELSLIWGSETQAAQSAGNGSYQALKAAVKERKDALTPVAEEVAA